MNGNEMLLATVTSGLALLLAWRGLRSHNLPGDRLMKMAGIWIIIIVIVALAARAMIG